MLISCMVSRKADEEDECVANLGEPVFVNVYHLHWQNGMKVGAYHTGTVVYDKEYGFGGHPFPTSGIFQIEPKNIEEMGEGFTYKETLYVGRTYLSKEGVDRLLISLTDEFRGDAYHLLHFNCNHFTANFIQLLCDGVLPKWINLLARFAAGVPFIESMLPAHWVRPSLLYDSDFEEFMKSCQSDMSDFSDKDHTHSIKSSHLSTSDTDLTEQSPNTKSAIPCPHTNGSVVRSRDPVPSSSKTRSP
ncbi:PPPDE peptidase domain-containing protein 1 [Fasciola gigantica]|uniref:PPPDE peptidase domain-containing protein 1 n=1 Tax=Fasciola gigantica TaxID=46835 RepID=A0A504YVU9_FASGI|nr:PPPDE peptidase domain-containing protein 1 [Fasciola gigantica]